MGVLVWGGLIKSLKPKTLSPMVWGSTGDFLEELSFVAFQKNSTILEVGEELAENVSKVFFKKKILNEKVNEEVRRK